MNLEFGCALQVEDLDVTMNVVTFVSPYVWSFAEVERLKTRLIKHDISFMFIYRRTNIPEWQYPWNYKLEVGDRTLLFHVRN